MRLSFPEYHLFQALKRFENQHLPLDLFLSHYFRAHKALGSKDRLLITDAVYGITRWRSLLDFLIGEHATWESRYAIYRGFKPQQYLYVNSIPPHVRVSFPKELFALLEADYGEEKAMRLCQICNTPAPITIRANPLKTTREELLKTLIQKNCEASPCELSPLGIQFKKRAPLTQLSEFKEGLFEIQDEASQMVSFMLKVKPGEHVLDYCSGSGGKTLGFAHVLENTGQIYLHDIRPIILEQAKKRLKRAGVQNAQVVDPNSETLENLRKKMDWVLADVPCSGTGTLRRNPDQKWKFSIALINRLVGEQRAIFEKALSFLKKGGKIVYATCSILKAENEKQVQHFLKTYPLKLVDAPFVSHPSYGGMDGFFAATMQKMA